MRTRTRKGSGKLSFPVEESFENRGFLKSTASEMSSPGHMEKIIVDAKNAGQRVDKFLKKEFFLYTRGEIIRRIKKGDVNVNEKVVKPSYILEEEDVLTLNDFDHEVKEEGLEANSEVELNILFENEYFLVVDKPAGLQVHPGFKNEKNTLVNGLLAKYPEIANVHDDSEGSELRPGIVHRLDRDTSGVMVIARTMETFAALKGLFKSREVEKKYLAIVEETFATKSGKIEKPIARATNYRKQVIARPNTKTIVRNAETNYKVIEECKNYSMVEVLPKTGRMHQIRVHMASIGHPVVGDRIYGKKDSKNALNETKRQLLHANILKFELFGKKYEFLAPMPEDFEKFKQNYWN